MSNDIFSVGNLQYNNVNDSLIVTTKGVYPVLQSKFCFVDKPKWCIEINLQCVFFVKMQQLQQKINFHNMYNM